MGRRFVSLLAASLLALLAVMPAAAKGPDRNWLPEDEIPFGAEYCGFPVLLEDSFSSVKELVFRPDEDGNQRVITGGLFKSTLTRADPERSTDVNLGGRIRIDIWADGTATAQGTGSVLVWYAPGAEAAVSELGAGLFVVHGRATERYGLAGLVEATYTGRVTDVCALLEG